MVQNQMNTFLEFLRHAAESKLLIEQLLKSLFTGDQGLQIQITELLKYITDVSHEKRNEILDLFYDIFLPLFLEHFQQIKSNDRYFSFVQQYVDILIHCVRHHGYRMRHYIIQHKLLHVLYQGFQMNEKSVSLSVIRFVKNIVLSRDDFLVKYIVNNNLLDPIFDIYLKNARKDNLLCSVCLELFAVIQKEKFRKLIQHFGYRFEEKVQSLELDPQHTLQKLLADYKLINDKMLVESESLQLHQNSEIASIGYIHSIVIYSNI